MLTKLLFRHLLSLLILFLSGYNLVSANTDIGNPFRIQLINYDIAPAGISETQPGHQSFIDPASSGSKKENDKIDAAEYEEEDDKFHAFKHRMESANYPTVILTAPCFSNGINSTVSFNKELPYNSSHKYLYFQVFRL